MRPAAPKPVPPTGPRAPGDALADSLPILEELPDPRAVVVWNAFRAVVLWAETPARERAGLFCDRATDTRLAYLAEAGFPTDADAALSTLAAVLANPAQADAELVSSACLRLSRWLASAGAPRSAFSLAQAAALALPHHPAPALEAGVLGVRADAPQQAEEWFRRARARAYRTGQPGCFVAAAVHLARSLERRGCTAAARRYYRRAVDEAGFHGVESPARGEAHAALFRVACAKRDYPAARDHAFAALRYLPSAERRRIMHAVAEMWVRQGKPVRAVALLRRLAPARKGPAEQAESWVLMAEAAAQAGLRAWFDRGWEQAQRLLCDLGDAAPERLAKRLGKAAARMLDATLNGARRGA